MDLEQDVEAALVQMRPYLDSDGVTCELDRVEDNIAYVHMEATKRCCPTILMTIKMGIERRIVEAVPQIEAVEPIRKETVRA